MITFDYVLILNNYILDTKMNYKHNIVKLSYIVCFEYGHHNHSIFCKSRKKVSTDSYFTKSPAKVKLGHTMKTYCHYISMWLCLPYYNLV